MAFLIYLSSTMVVFAGVLTLMVIIKSKGYLLGMSISGLETSLNLQAIISIILVVSLGLCILVLLYIYSGGIFNVNVRIVFITLLIVIVLILIVHLVGLVLKSSVLSLIFISQLGELTHIQFEGGLNFPSLTIWLAVLGTHPVINTIPATVTPSWEYWAWASVGILAGSTLMLVLFLPVMVLIIPALFEQPANINNRGSNFSVAQFDRFIEHVNCATISRLNHSGRGLGGFSGQFTYKPSDMLDRSSIQPLPAAAVIDHMGLPQIVGVNLPALGVQGGVIQFPPIPAGFTPAEVEQVEISRILIQSLYNSARSEEHLALGLDGLYRGQVPDVPIEAYNPLEVIVWAQEVLRLWRLR